MNYKINSKSTFTKKMKMYSKINKINKIYQLNFQFCQLTDKRRKFMLWIIIYEKKFILLMFFCWKKNSALFIVPVSENKFLTFCTAAWATSRQACRL